MWESPIFSLSTLKKVCVNRGWYCGERSLVRQIRFDGQTLAKKQCQVFFSLINISALLLNLEIQVQLPAIFSGIHEGRQQQSKYLFSSKVGITNQDLN